MNVARTIADVRAALEPTGEAGRSASCRRWARSTRATLSLLAAARDECDTVVMSLFVNPAQFGDRADLDALSARRGAATSTVARAAGVDVVFAPSADELYPPGFQTWVDVDRARRDPRRRAPPRPLQRRRDRLPEALHDRPARRRLLRPEGRAAGRRAPADDRATSRSSSSCASLPTVRDADGLALSSRNVRLSRRRARARPRPAARARDARPRARRASSLRRARGRLRRGRAVQPARPRRRRPRRRHPPDRQRPHSKEARMSTRPRTPARRPGPGKLPITELAGMKDAAASRSRWSPRTTRRAPARGRGRRRPHPRRRLGGDGRPRPRLDRPGDDGGDARADPRRHARRARPLVVADMPFGSFQVSDERRGRERDPLRQGGRRRRGQARGRRADASRVRAIVGAGIP